MPDVIRAGERVRMNAAALEVFPRYEGMAGKLEGYDRVGLARVRFDGRAAAIQIDASYLERDDTNPRPKATRKNESETAKRNRIAQENRRLIRAAFDKIRYDPEQKALVSDLAGALGGRIKVTDPVLGVARRIVNT